MEKRGIIQHGRTPPEKEADEKQASTPTLTELEDDPTRRLAEGVAKRPLKKDGEEKESSL